MAAPGPKEWSTLEQERWEVLHRAFDLHFNSHVSLGTIQGATPVSFGATIEDLAAADGEVLLYEAGLAKPAALDASTVYLISSSASDTDVYRVLGIDANGDEQVQNVTATGTTPAAVPGTWDHVQSCVNTTTGSSNVGTVYISTDAAALPTTVGDQIQIAMPPGDNYAINPVYVVPNDHFVWFDAFAFSGNTNANGAIVRIFANRQGTDIINFKFYIYDANMEQDFHTPIRFFEGDRLYVTIQAVSGTNTDASFGMNGILLHKVPPTLDRNKANIGELFE